MNNKSGGGGCGGCRGAWEVCRGGDARVRGVAVVGRCVAVVAAMVICVDCGGCDGCAHCGEDTLFL